MEVKGTSLRGTIDFVKTHFPERYSEWISEMPKGASELFSCLILSNKWYTLNDGLIAPIETISRLFYKGDDYYAAHYMGQCHAELTLTGIYKFFVQMNSPRFIIERGINVLHTYFQPLSASVRINGKNSASILIEPYDTPHIVFEASIAGWTEKAIEISGGKNVRTQIIQSHTKQDAITEILLTWE